jgi:hypothetical protein
VSLDVRNAGRVVRHVGEHKSLLVVILAEDLVLAQVEAVAHAEPTNKRETNVILARERQSCLVFLRI